MTNNNTLFLNKRQSKQLRKETQDRLQNDNTSPRQILTLSTNVSNTDVTATRQHSQNNLNTRQHNIRIFNAVPDYTTFRLDSQKLMDQLQKNNQALYGDQRPQMSPMDSNKLQNLINKPQTSLIRTFCQNGREGLQARLQQTFDQMAGPKKYRRLELPIDQMKYNQELEEINRQSSETAEVKMQSPAVPKSEGVVEMRIHEEEHKESGSDDQYVDDYIYQPEIIKIDSEEQQEINANDIDEIDMALQELSAEFYPQEDDDDEIKTKVQIFSEQNQHCSYNVIQSQCEGIHQLRTGMGPHRINMNSVSHMSGMKGYLTRKNAGQVRVGGRFQKLKE